MVEETNEMRDARHELQRLSASDPLAQANILRHVAACTQLLTGRPGAEALPGEPLVGAGFRLVHGEERLFASLSRRDGVERVYIAFDIDDPQGPPLGIGLFRKEGEHVVCYGLCQLWAPVGSSRAVLVPTGEGGPAGHFAFRRGQPFRWIDGSVPGDPAAGQRRASARMAKLLKIAGETAVHRRGFVSVVSNVGQTVLSRPLEVAA